MKTLISSIRVLARHRPYTVLAVLTLAAGIGVNAAVFGLVDAVYFRPLPLAHPERLVELKLESPGSRFGFFSYEKFRDIERDAPAFEDVFAIGQRGVDRPCRGGDGNRTASGAQRQGRCKGR